MDLQILEREKINQTDKLLQNVIVRNDEQIPIISPLILIEINFFFGAGMYF